MNNDFYYINKDILDNKLILLQENQSAIVRKITDELGVIIRRKGNEYLITRSYISGPKQKYFNDYDFTK